MVKSTVVLLLRIRLAEGKRVYAAPAISKNGKMKPLAAVIGGKVEHHPEAVYVLRYREQGRVAYQQVGTDPDAAQISKLRLELELRTNADVPAIRAAAVPLTFEVPELSSTAASVAATPPSLSKRDRLHQSLNTLFESFIALFFATLRAGAEPDRRPRRDLRCRHVSGSQEAEIETHASPGAVQRNGPA